MSLTLDAIADVFANPCHGAPETYMTDSDVWDISPEIRFQKMRYPFLYSKALLFGLLLRQKGDLQRYPQEQKSCWDEARRDGVLVNITE